MNHSENKQKARIFVNGLPAGVLTNTGLDWHFEYFDSYIKNERPVSLLLPVRAEPYQSNKLFSYFEGLFVEGWQKSQMERTFGAQTLMETLLYRCAHSVGDVQIGPWERDTLPKERFETLISAQATNRNASKICLFCLTPIDPLNGFEYHADCSEKFFGKQIPPAFAFTKDDLPSISLKSLSSGITIPGVQQKVSMAYGFNHYSYIIKPQVNGVREVPELENLWMDIAGVLNLTPALHGLCRLQDGSRAYITLRFDRTPNGRLHVEDFSQLMGKTTYENDKYESSYLEMAETIDKWISYRRKEQKIRFFEMLVFNFIFGNNDAHLKNFALIRVPKPRSNHLVTIISPVYDLVPTAFVEEKGRQPEMALPLIPGGKLRDITRSDFESFATNIGLKENSLHNFLDKLKDRRHQILDLAQRSLVSKGKRDRLQRKIEKRLKALRAEGNWINLAE